MSSEDVQVIGVLGGGQLGRMLAQAGRHLGIEVRCYDPDPEACAGQVTSLTAGALDDFETVERFAKACDALTCEFENIPVSTLQALEAQGHVVRPGSGAIATAQDRILEKRMFERLGLPVQAHAEVACLEDLQKAASSVGLPAVLKTRRDGYDGKGQVVIRAAAELEDAWAKLAPAGCILEAFVPFAREISVVVARDVMGRIEAFPVTENVHVNGILHRSAAPARGAGKALEYARTLIENMPAGTEGYVGVLALEMFETAEGELVTNECAPRVHNSGHWTMDAGSVDQFSQHLLAVAGRPIEACGVHQIAPTAMINLVGVLPPEHALAACGGRVHLYGKQPRLGRKLGHINWSSKAIEDATACADAWAAQWLGRDRLVPPALRPVL